MVFNKPQLAFSTSLPYAIWQIRWDPVQKRFGIETRHPDDGGAYLFYLDAKKGVLLQKEYPMGYPLPDKAWTLVGIWDGIFLARKMGQQQPYALGIMAIDARNGQVIWELPHMRFVKQEGPWVACQIASMVSGPLQWVHLQEGKLQQQPTTYTAIEETLIEGPELYTAEAPEWVKPYQPIGDIYRMHLNGGMLWCFQYVKKCENSSGYFVRWMGVKEEKICFEEDILGPLPQLLPEIFFKIDQQLFLIGNNKREFVSYLV
jgi:hypothetical protein